jgi:MFS family permease
MSDIHSEVHFSYVETNQASVLCTDRHLRWNLFLLSIGWMSCMAGYFIINFQLKYLKGSLYINSIITGMAELVSMMSVGPILFRFGLKKLFLYGYVMGLIGTICLIFIPVTSPIIMPIFLLVSRFGISMALVGGYQGVTLLMPTHVCATALGICNFFGRITAMIAPMIAELPDRWPNTIMALFIVASLITSQCIQTKRAEPDFILSDLSN